MLGSTAPRTVTLPSLGGDPRPGLGLLASHLAVGFFWGGAMGLLHALFSHQYPSPLWHVGEPGTGRGDIGGGPWRDEQGHRVEAGKVVRTRSLNLN